MSHSIDNRPLGRWLLFRSIRGSCREFMLACHNRMNLRIVNQYSDFTYSLLLFLGVGSMQITFSRM